MVAVLEEDAPCLQADDAPSPCENATAELTDPNSDASNRSGDQHEFRESISGISASSSAKSRRASSASSMRSSSNLGNSSNSNRIRLSHAESVQNINVEKLTMNKLRFGSLKLHGRKKEMETLRKSFDRFVNNLADTQSSASASEGGDTSKRQNLARRGSKLARRRGSKKIAELFPDFSITNSSEVVFISGESGTGKVS